MGRRARITKEMVLEAAYELLDEEGIGAVAIKPVAARLGCSTQPVSWLFGSMTELKKELFIYSSHRLYDRMETVIEGKDAIETFYMTGVEYISNACDHPNVFRFINVDDTLETVGERMLGDTSIFSERFDHVAVEALASQYDVDPAMIEETVKDIVIYTHGLAVMMIYDNYKLPKEEACKMMYNMGRKMLGTIGIDTE
ncbi:MAG: TetR family transcriptional regulator [Lachnospiraceae bacterium]|nr:TetR family transcriptional regulator [Lachnospiraceae bacterium]